MTVSCKTTVCPYCNQFGLCEKNTIGIDESGMCTEVWRKGQQIGFNRPASPSQHIVVIDRIFEEDLEKGEAAAQSKGA